MFEKYTEKARRVIFFARYEASQHGAMCIETPCLLLGILRENKGLMARLLPAGSGELARLSADVEALLPVASQRISTSVDLPLSHAAKRVLTYASEESDRFQHSFIDPRHLLVGLLIEDGPEAPCLRAHGIELEKVRADLARPAGESDPSREANQKADEARRRGAELLKAWKEMPAERLAAAMVLLDGLASGKFEVTGTSRNGPFHFSLDDKDDKAE